MKEYRISIHTLKTKLSIFILAVTSSYKIHDGKLWRVASKKRKRFYTGYGIEYGLERDKTAECTWVIRTPLLVRFIEYTLRKLVKK